MLFTKRIYLVFNKILMKIFLFNHETPPEPSPFSKGRAGWGCLKQLTFYSDPVIDLNISQKNKIVLDSTEVIFLFSNLIVLKIFVN